MIHTNIESYITSTKTQWNQSQKYSAASEDQSFLYFPPKLSCNHLLVTRYLSTNIYIKIYLWHNKLTFFFPQSQSQTHYDLLVLPSWSRAGRARRVPLILEARLLVQTLGVKYVATRHDSDFGEAERGPARVGDVKLPYQKLPTSSTNHLHYALVRYRVHFPEARADSLRLEERPLPVLWCQKKETRKQKFSFFLFWNN